MDTHRRDDALPPMKCLLVDDLQENLIALSALLRRPDVELLTARSGAEALDLLLSHEVALVFLDVQMPEMDGFELAEIMRGSERTRDIPLIFVTAGASDRQRVFKGYEAGAVDFLFKPIEPHVLQSKTNVFLQIHRQKQQLARDLKERTETLRLNEMFMAVLGHDLRGPLNSMILAAQLLQTRTDPFVEDIGARLLRNGHWMSRMIADLLDLARTRLGEGLHIERRRLDLAVLADRVTRECQDNYPERVLNLNSLGDPVGEWDEDRLAQVLTNLTGNAFDHGTKGESIDVLIDGRDPQTVTFSVSNGGRIPDDMLPHVFDPFRSGTQRHANRSGLGLGLYIVQQIVQAHGGSIDARSEGRRTEFRASLPRRGAAGIAPPMFKPL
jgi:signal transduction histidine kinase